MSYPCGPNTLGKTHRMGGIGRVEVALDKWEWRKVRHPNPGKINFRRSDPRHPKHPEHGISGADGSVIYEVMFPPIPPE